MRPYLLALALCTAAVPALAAGPEAMSCADFAKLDEAGQMAAMAPGSGDAGGMMASSGDAGGMMASSGDAAGTMAGRRWRHGGGGRLRGASGDDHRRGDGGDALTAARRSPACVPARSLLSSPGHQGRTG